MYFSTGSDGTAPRSESCSPRPMTWLAASRAGTGRPISRAASWIDRAMPAVESISVPSQSNTISGYFRSDIGLREVQSAKREHIAWQRNFQREPPVFERVLEHEPARVQ